MKEDLNFGGMRGDSREMFERFYQAGEAKGLAFGTHCWSADPGF